MSSRTLVSPCCPRAPLHKTGRAIVLLVLLLSAAPVGAARVQQPATSPQSDGPVKVEGGWIYKQGKFRVEKIDPSKVAPMPKGWEAYQSTAYKIDFGEGIISGPHVIHFRMEPAIEQKVFDSLIVLYAERDKIDQKYFWQDCRIFGEDAIAHNFATKTISAKTDQLGVFVVARLVEPPISAEADISVEIIAPSGRAVGNRELTYEIKINNSGPQAAKEIVLEGSGFSSDEFVSATPPSRGNGRCRQDGSNFGCKLDLLEKGATAVFRLVLVPREGPRLRYPEEGQHFTVLALANSFASIDENQENNQARNDLLVYPDPNVAPKVKLTAPAEGTLFVALADIKVTTEASDSDGMITKVDFYDGETLIGAGVPAGKNLYSVDWKDVLPGIHYLSVVVTDDGGRSNHDTMLVTVNGALAVRVGVPSQDAVLQLSSKYGEKHEIVYGTLSLDATAFISANGRNVKNVVFNLYPRDQILRQMHWREEVAKPVGTDRATGETRYGVTFSKLMPTSYVLTVKATDDEGVMTVSSPVGFRVNAAPLVQLRPEMNKTTTYTHPVIVTLRADVLDDFGPLGIAVGARAKGGKVDFYADGKLIGSAPTDGFIESSSFEWSNPSPGIYAITAIATESDGIASEPSNPLRITILK